MDGKNRLVLILPSHGVTVDQFREWLSKMPSDARLVGAGYDFNYDHHMLGFESEKFPWTPHLAPDHKVVPQMFLRENGDKEIVMPEIPIIEEAP